MLNRTHQRCSARPGACGRLVTRNINTAIADLLTCRLLSKGALLLESRVGSWRMPCVAMNAKTWLQSSTMTCIRCSCSLRRRSSTRRRFGDRPCEIELHNGALRNGPHSALPVVQAYLGCFQSTVALVAVHRVVFPTSCAEEANPTPRSWVNGRVIVGVLSLSGAPSLESKVVICLFCGLQLSTAAAERPLRWEKSRAPGFLAPPQKR